MVVLIVLASIAVITSVLRSVYKRHYVSSLYSHSREDWISAVQIGSILFLFIFLASILVNHVATRGDIERYHATVKLVDQYRASTISSAEQTALALQIVETNSWLRYAQYWQRSMWRLWWPAEIAELEPIQAPGGQ